MANERIPGARTEPKHELCQKANRNPPKKKLNKKKTVWMNLNLYYDDRIITRSQSLPVSLSDRIACQRCTDAMCNMQMLYCRCATNTNK